MTLLAALILAGLLCVVNFPWTTTLRVHQGNIRINTSDTSQKKSDAPKLQHQFWADLTVSDCHFALKGRFVHYEKCHEEVSLTSTFGAHTVSCADLPYIVLFGVVHLKSGPCSEILKTNELCEGYPMDGSPFMIPCRKTMRLDSKLVISFLSLCLIVQVCLFRALWILKVHNCVNGKLKSRTMSEGLLIFSLYSPENKVFFSKKFKDEVSVSPRVGNIKIERFNWKAALLLFLFIHRPTEVQGQVEKKKDLDLTIQAGESINIGQFYFTLINSTTTYEVSQLYRTSDVTVRWTWNTDCQFSRCGGIGECKRGGINGLYSASVLKQVNQSDPRKGFIITNCEWGNSKCLFTSGCDTIRADILYDDKSQLKVYEISGGAHHFNSISTTNDRCRVNRIQPHTDNSNVDVKLVGTLNGKHFLCRHVSDRNLPKAGTMGAIQVNERDEFVIDKDVIRFTHSSSTGFGLDVKHSNNAEWLSKCVKLPGVYQGEHYTLANSQLVKERGSLTTISVECPEHDFDKLSDHGCGGLLYEVSGIHGEMTSVMLHAFPKHSVSNQVWTGILPCTSQETQIDCTSNGVIIRVSWPNTCLESIKLEAENVVINSGFVQPDDYVSSFPKVETFESGFLKNLLNLFSNIPFSLFGISPGVLLIVGLLVVVRR